MAAALATRCRIKRNHRRLRRVASGRTVYTYVEGNPVSNIDPLGLESWQYSNGMTPANGISDCEQAAMADSVLNLLPVVGALKAFTEGPDSLDAMSSGLSTVTLVTELGTRRGDAASNTRLQELERWGRNRREQASLRTAIQGNNGLRQFLRAGGRSLFVLSAGIEATKLDQAVKKCGCQSK